MKSFSFRNFLALSVLLHMMVSWVFSFHDHQPLPVATQPLEVEVLTLTNREKTSSLTRPTKNPKVRSRKTAAASKKLLQDIRSSTKIRFGDSISHSKESSGNMDPGSDSWGSRSVSIESLENTLFYKTIYEAIDGSVYYPAVLAKRKIEGTFQARLTFDAVEGCLWKKAVISEGNPHLRLFVLDLLRRACDNETVRRLRPLRTVTADLSFLFAIGEGPGKLNFEEDRRKHGPRMIGNVLMFEAHSIQSVMAWQLGPFTGVFPIPYVSVDFEWLQENWDKVVNGKIKTLPTR